MFKLQLGPWRTITHLCERGCHGNKRNGWTSSTWPLRGADQSWGQKWRQTASLSNVSASQQASCCVWCSSIWRYQKIPPPSGVIVVKLKIRFHEWNQIKNQNAEININYKQRPKTIVHGNKTNPKLWLSRKYPSRWAFGVLLPLWYDCSTKERNWQANMSKYELQWQTWSILYAWRWFL